MAESVKKRSEIEEQDTWKLEDMIESLEKFEELMDGVEERIQEYEAYRGKLGNSAEYLKNYLTYDESVDETLSLLYAYAMQRRDQDTSVSENQALVSRVQSLAVKAMAASSFADPEILSIPDEKMAEFRRVLFPIFRSLPTIRNSWNGCWRKRLTGYRRRRRRS